MNSTPESEVAGRSTTEFRPFVAFSVLAGVIVLASVALLEHGIEAWIAGGMSICLGIPALYRFQRERLLLKKRATTIATVTYWEKSNDSDGGYSYSVRYQFRGPEGKVYSGKETSQVELPQQGEMLPISFLTDDPNQKPTTSNVLVLSLYLHGLRQMDG